MDTNEEITTVMQDVAEDMGYDIEITKVTMTDREYYTTVFQMCAGCLFLFCLLALIIYFALEAF